MKKLLCFLLSICLLGALAFAEPVPDAEASEEEGFVFLLPGSADVSIALSVDAEFAPLLTLLGEPIGLFESESCAFQGIDRVYTYPSFAVYTYPQEGLDRISSIYLMDDMVETSEGICIGMQEEQVLLAYGEPTLQTGSAYTYQKGGCALSFLFDAEGCVSAITYISLFANPQ